MSEVRTTDAGKYECWETGKPDSKSDVTVTVKRHLHWPTYTAIKYFESGTENYAIDASDAVTPEGTISFTWKSNQELIGPSSANSEGIHLQFFHYIVITNEKNIVSLHNYN